MSASPPTLTVIAAAGRLPTATALTVPSPIVVNERGERFVVRNVRDASPRPNLVLTEEELSENLRNGLFVETPRWAYRPGHALLFLRGDLYVTLQHRHTTPVYAETTVRTDGVRVFYAALDQLASFRHRAADCLLRAARVRLIRVRDERGSADVHELEQWLLWASVIAAHGSADEESAAVLWVVFQMDHHPERVDAAHDAALRLRGMSAEKLRELVRQVRASHRPPANPETDVRACRRLVGFPSLTHAAPP